MVHGGFNLKRCSVLSSFSGAFSICAIIRFLGADGQVTKMCADLGDYDHHGEWR